MNKLPGAAYAASLQLGLTQSVLLASLPLLVAHTGIPFGQWSLFLGATLLLTLVATPWWGRHIDRHGGWQSLKKTAVGTLACNLLLAIALFLPQPPLAAALILLSRIGYALFACGQYPSSQTLLLQGLGSNSPQRSMARLTAANHAGRLLGPGLVAASAALWYPLPIAVLLCAGAALALYGTGKHSPIPAGNSPTPSAAKRTDSAVFRRCWPALCCAFLTTAVASTLQFTLSYSLAEHFSLSPQQAAQHLSTVLLIATAVGLLGALLIVPAVSAAPRRQFAVLCLSLLSGAVMLLQTFSFALLLLATSLLSLGLAVAAPAYASWAHARHADRPGAMTSSLASSHTLGHAAGIVFAGAAGIEWLGISYVGILLAVVTLCVLMSGVLLHRARALS
ncbi:hypothetical protein [Spongiibacter sp.]|uniref:hypothetical protein n=1 Tax=Spongiibacter sp. TaxID=2024860 RepID=UPI00356287E1